MEPSVQAERKLVSHVLTVVLAFAGLDLLSVVVLNFPAIGFSVFLLIVSLFVALLLLFAFGSWRASKWGYLGGAVLVIIVNLFFGDPTEILMNPAGPAFVNAMGFYAATLVAVPYGIYAFYRARRTVSMPKQMPRSSMLALIALGVLLGGLVVGLFAGGTQARLLLTAGAQADITIVPNAASLPNGLSFSPLSFPVKAGTTVTWINRDPVSHTVTSTLTPTLFGSPTMLSGDTFKFTFAQPGTYEYYCVIHPNMKGTIIVTA